MKVLIVEDETELAASMFNYLQNQGYFCQLAYDIEQAQEQISQEDFDIIVLDIMLPLGSGIDLLRMLKLPRKGETVIVISAKNSDDDKTISINLGAADYLVKPFHLAELSARIQSSLRNNNANHSKSIDYKNLQINLTLGEVKVEGNEIELSKTELSILLFLVVNKDKVVSKSAIAENLNGKSALYFDNFDIITAHIKKLKNKLGVAGAYIETIYDTGYKLN